MIDYFTKNELLHFQYVLLGKVTNNGKLESVGNCNLLYPSVDVIDIYEEGNIKAAKKMYREYLFPKNENKNWIYPLLNETFINTLTLHHDVILMYTDDVKPYIDFLMEFLYDELKLEFLDLNKLFEEGKVGPLYLDLKALQKKIRPMIREEQERKNALVASTEQGRNNLLSKMNTQDKIKKLKELGIKVSKDDIKEKKLDKLLHDAWVVND